MKECKYCNGSLNMLLTKEIVDGHYIGWNKDILATELEYINLDVCFEVRNNKGYIRLGDKNDMQCLDHGLKFEVPTCIKCGRVLKEEL